MFCIHCGHSGGVGDAFCGKCGAAMPAGPAQPPTAEHRAVPVPERAKPRAILKWAIAAGVLVLVAALGAAVFIRSRHVAVAPASDAVAREFDFTRLAPSVLTIYCLDKDGNEIGQGSGFVVRSDGIAITNWHVAKDAYSMTAQNGTGVSFKIVRLINVDEESDLVTMQLEAPTGETVTFVPLQPADSRTIVPGQKVFTLSAPRGLSQTITDGLLSAIRTVEGLQLFQMTAAVSPGSSGGPVFDQRGEVIGIIKSQLSSGQQLNFAIPIDVAVRLINESSNMAHARATDPSPASATSALLFERALTAFQAEKYGDASKLFEQVIVVDREQSAAYFNAGLAYAQLEDFGHASDYFRRFLALAPADDVDIPRAKGFLAAYAADLGRQAASDRGGPEPVEAGTSDPPPAP